MADAKLFIDIIFRNIKNQLNGMTKQINSVFKGAGMTAAQSRELKTQASLEQQKVKTALSSYKLELAKTKEVERQARIEERKAKKAALDKIKAAKADFASKYTSKTDNYENLRRQSQLVNTIKEDLGTNNNVYKQAVNYLNKMGKELGLNNKQMKRLQINTKRFSFEFLTLIFAGMMLKRVFGGALRSIYDNYKKIVGMNSQFNKSVMKLGASWSYLKFVIGNALNSPFVIRAVEWLTDSIEWLADVLAENKDLAIGLVGALAGLYALGELASFIGGFMQFGMLMTALLKGALLLISPLGIALGILLLMVAAVATYESYRDRLVAIWEEGVIPAIKNTIESFLSLLGFTDAGEDQWKKFGAIATWVLALLSAELIAMLTGFDGVFTATKYWALEFEKTARLVVAALGWVWDSFNAWTADVVTSMRDAMISVVEFIVDKVDALQNMVGIELFSTKGMKEQINAAKALSEQDRKKTEIIRKNRDIRGSDYLQEEKRINAEIDQLYSDYTDRLDENIAGAKKAWETISLMPKGIYEKQLELEANEVETDTDNFITKIQSKLQDVTKDIKLPQFDLDQIFGQSLTDVTDKFTADTGLNQAIAGADTWINNLDSSQKAMSDSFSDREEVMNKEIGLWDILKDRVDALIGSLGTLDGQNATYTTTHVIRTVYEDSGSGKVVTPGV